MMQPVLPYQIYSRALEECYTEEEWAQEQCPTEREVFHNSLPSILLYREYPQYIIVCSSLHIYCVDKWSTYYCVDTVGSSCRGGVDTPLPLSDTFLQIFRRIFGE